MQKLRKVSIVAATFLLAAATGHVMQTAQAPAPDAPGSAPLPGAAAQVAAAQSSPGPLPIPPAAQAAPQPIRVTGLTIAEVAALPQLPARPMAADAPATGPALPADPTETGFADAACAPGRLSLAPAPRALVAVAIEAPCAAGARVTLRQAAMDFAARLDAGGRWNGLLPALAPQVALDVLLPDGVTLSASQPVPGTEALNRVIVLWSGAAAVQLNAYEYGSDHGGAGHIFAGAPRTPDTPLGGYLLAYGDGAEGPHAEVYSAPATMTDIRFDLEAPLSEASCGRDLDAQVVHLRAGQMEPPVTLRLAMPDCGADPLLQSAAGSSDPLAAVAASETAGSVIMPLPGPALALAATR